jgi:uncharacterized membrane protein
VPDLSLRRLGLRRPKTSRRQRHVIVPAAYIALALALGFAAPRLGDGQFVGVVSILPPESALALLSAIASGMMALTGIGFSIIFVFFQLSSSAYTPRLLAEFARSRLTPHALGIFVGTFLYAALAIRAIGPAGKSVSSAGVTWIALGWLLASVSVLLLLVGKLRALSISEVLAELGERGLYEVRAGYDPYQPNAEDAAAAVVSTLDADGPLQVVAHAGVPLYVVQIDRERLLAAARAVSGLVLVPFAVGDAVMPGDALALIHRCSHRSDEMSVRSAIRLSRERTIEGNAPFALRLLVDIAIRALSPAVNDPTTAVAVLDQIEALLRAFGGAKLERGIVRDEAGTVRVVAMHPNWEDLLALGLCEIAQYGQESIQVQRRLGALLADLIQSVPASRQPAVEYWQLCRQQLLARAELSPSARDLAGCLDRQGLGHTLNRQQPCVAPSVPPTVAGTRIGPGVARSASIAGSSFE